MAYLQSDRYQKGHFHKIWVEYYIVWEKIRQMRHFVQNLLVVKVYTSKRYKMKGNTMLMKRQCYRYYQEKICKILKLWWHFQATNLGKIFGIWKKKNQDEPISYSCINLRMKLLIKLQNSPKNRAKMKFYIFWEAVSQFCFRQTLHLFRLHSAPRNDAG